MDTLEDSEKNGVSKNSVVLHVMFDEKFNDMAIRQFDAAGICRNEYWITSPQLLLTRSRLAIQCTERQLIRQLGRKDISAVVFHSLPPSRYKLLSYLKKDVRVIWIGWGYDYYNILQRAEGIELLLPATRRSTRSSMAKNMMDVMRGLRYPARHLARIDYFSPVLDSEFDRVVRAADLTAKYINWNYGTAEDDLSLGEGSIVDDVNILVGNSASAPNNHLDVFQKLVRAPVRSGASIICPLSYGDKKYAAMVAKNGRELFGEKFKPIDKFLHKNDYLKIIKSCGFVVMGHLRQQGVGNVCGALLMGAKVYLDEGNPLHSWLVSRGATLGSVSNIDMVPLSKREREINREVILANWGRSIQREKTAQMLQVAIRKAL